MTSSLVRENGPSGIFIPIIIITEVNSKTKNNIYLLYKQIKLAGKTWHELSWLTQDWLVRPGMNSGGSPRTGW